MQKIQITGPAFEPVTLEELKDHARVSHSREDDKLATFMRAARAACEQFCKTGFCSQQSKIQLDDVPETDTVKIPVNYVTAVTIQYLDTAGAQQDFDLINAYTYFTEGGDGVPARVSLKPSNAWPITQGYGGAFWLNVTHGKASPGAVHQDVRQAILSAATYWFKNRSGHRKTDSPAKMVSTQQELQLPPEVQTTLQPHQLIWL